MTEQTQPETPANTMPERAWLYKYGLDMAATGWCADENIQIARLAYSGMAYIRADVAEADVETTAKAANIIVSEFKEQIAALTAELAELRKDKTRLDWLSDRDNQVGNVMLPSWAVEENLHSLRAAIDAVMASQQESNQEQTP